MADDINELFNKDPMQLTNQDLDKIIERLREMRKSYRKTGDKKAGVSPRKRKAKPHEGLDLGDIEI